MDWSLNRLDPCRLTTKQTGKWLLCVSNDKQPIPALIFRQPPTEAVRIPLGQQAHSSEMEVFEAVATGEDFVDDEESDEGGDPALQDDEQPTHEQREFAQSLEQALSNASKP